MQADVLTVREAATQLGISGQRVRQLISAGSLPARRSSSGWLIRADDIADKERRARGRPASPRTAWAVLSLLSSALEPEAAEPLPHVVSDPRLRYHALQVLKAMPDPADDPERWRALLASRGRAERMWAHPGLVSRLVEDPQVSEGGDRAAARIGEGLSRTAVRDVYVAEPNAQRIVESYRLRPDPDGQVMLHVVPSSVPKDLIAMRGGLVPAAAAAADLLDEGDPRARRSALHQLHAMLEAWTDEHQLRSPARSDNDGHGANSAS
jgi:excisionase family DNA binding protein